MRAAMAYRIDYVADERTARITPEAFCARLRQSGFPVAATTADDGVVEIESGDVKLEVYVEAGFVCDIVGDVTFVDDRQTERLLELIESMGWRPAEG